MLDVFNLLLQIQAKMGNTFTVLDIFCSSPSRSSVPQYSRRHILIGSHKLVVPETSGNVRPGVDCEWVPQPSLRTGIEREKGDRLNSRC